VKARRGGVTKGVWSGGDANRGGGKRGEKGKNS